MLRVRERKFTRASPVSHSPPISSFMECRMFSEVSKKPKGKYTMRNMLDRLKVVALLACCGLAPVALTAGCEEGPFEEAGEEIDDAADEVGDALDG